MPFGPFSPLRPLGVSEWGSMLQGVHAAEQGQGLSRPLSWLLIAGALGRRQVCWPQNDAFSHACFSGRGGLGEHPSHLFPSSLRMLLRNKKSVK